MGEKQNKRTRKIAEKTAKVMALELATAQIKDLMCQPFKIRWRFCKAILFSKKVKVSAEEAEKLKKDSYGSLVLPATKQGGK